MSTPITAEQFREGQAVLTTMREAVGAGAGGVIVSADQVRAIHRCALYLARQRNELGEMCAELLDYVHELEGDPEPPPPPAAPAVVVVLLRAA